MTDRLPLPLSERVNGATASLYSPQGREFDVAIGGIPFMLATYPETPQSTETIKVRKDQFDTEDPGEQSLTGYWRRSQASWHEGAGNRYQEANASNAAGLGFYTSSGVDVFTQGRLTLLKRMLEADSIAASYSRLRSHANGFSAVGDGELHTSPAATGTFASLHAPAGKVIADGLIADAYFYDVATDGTLYEGTVAAPGSATTWPCGSPVSRLNWGKHRLWAIGGRRVWQPDLSLAGGTAQDPIYTHPNRGWTYTCMAEGPSAMYFGGHDGASSSIQAISLDGSLTTAPYLSAATVTAAMPEGELVQELAVLAGQYVGIGTNRGFRLGVVTGDSALSYGPLIVEPEGITGCTAIGTQGRFFLVAFGTADGNAIAYRIDTSVQVSEGVFAYAADIDCEVVGSITSIASNGNSLLACTASNGKIYAQSETEYVPHGYIQSGRVRFRTTEPKQFRFLGVGIEPLDGVIAISIIKDNNTSFPLGTISRQGQLFTDSFQYDGAPMEYASIKLDLTPTEDGSAAPIVNSYLIRALPAVRPQRLITLPLLCFDTEQARSGKRYGGEDYGTSRLTALLGVEDRAEAVTFQDFEGGFGNHIVTIEGLKFVQSTPPRGADGKGGIILLELRTVDA